MPDMYIAFAIACVAGWLLVARHNSHVFFKLPNHSNQEKRVGFRLCLLFWVTVPLVFAYVVAGISNELNDVGEVLVPVSHLCFCVAVWWFDRWDLLQDTTYPKKK